MIGQRIGNYHVVRQVSEGSAGAIYEALHRRSKQRVAIRVLRPDLSQDQAAGVRLFNDVAALGGVQHRSVVTVHEAGMLPDGAAYVVMEYVEGHTLGAWIRGEGGELDGAVALSVAWQLAGVLQAAHQRGVLHGDLRPAGVLLVPEPAAPAGVRVKLPDLGLAWIEGPFGAAVAGRLEGAVPAPVYLAPEQLHEAGETTPLSDVFSLGAVLYHLLSGQPPFGLRGTAEVLAGARLRPLREVDPSIPEALAALVEGMLDPSPVGRPDTEQVAISLERLLVAEGLVPGPAPGMSAGSVVPTQRPRRRLTLVAAAAIVAVCGAGASLALHHGWRPSWPPRLLQAVPRPATVPTATASLAPAAEADPPGPAATPPPAKPAQAPAPPSAGPPAPLSPPELESREQPAQVRPTPVALDKAPIPPLRIENVGNKAKQRRPTRPARPGGRPTEPEGPSEAALPPRDPPAAPE